MMVLALKHLVAEIPTVVRGGYVKYLTDSQEAYHSIMGMRCKATILPLVTEIWELRCD